jgi:hypothetical protein
LHHWVLFSISQGQKSYRRVVNVGRHGAFVDNTVARVPSSARTSTVEEHLNAAIDSQSNALKTITGTGNLIQGKNRESGGNYPTDRVREPWPAIFVWVKTDVAIGRAKLPFPKPVRFFASAV